MATIEERLKAIEEKLGIEPLTLNGKEVTIENNNLNWGSNFVDIETAKATLKLKNVTRVRFSFCNEEVLISDLKQLLTKIEERENR